MRYTDKSELLLKYQKTKAKLIEYDVPNDSYPNFPINSNDLSFSTVYILSRYAESIIENDVELQAEFRPHLVKAAQYYDAAFESKERLQHDQNFLITGAVAYFLYNDFGSAKVLSSKLKFSLPIVNSPFHLLIVCLRYLLASKTQLFESDTSYCTNIYKSLLTYFRSGNDDGSTISWLSKYRQYTFNAGNALDVFYVDLLYAVVVFAMQKSAWSLLPQYSGITVDVWRSYLERREAVKILWQSQELLCTYGVLQGKNAIVQLPTGVGKTKSIEVYPLTTGDGECGNEAAKMATVINETTNGRLFVSPLKTFEYDLAMNENCSLMAEVIKEGWPKGDEDHSGVKNDCFKIQQKNNNYEDEESKREDAKYILNHIDHNDLGKGLFAQLLSEKLENGKIIQVPQYIENAIIWASGGKYNE